MRKTQQESEIEESRLLRAIELIEKESATKSLTLGELVTLLGDLGHGVLSLLLCLFFLQPIPLPGLSTPIGFIIALAAIAQFLNRPAWIPRRLRDYQIPQKALNKIAHVARSIWAVIERRLHPRLLFLTRLTPFRFGNLLLVLLSTIFLALPLPIPFSNTVPALVILAVTFAYLEDDGYLILLAYVLAALMLLFFYSLGAGVWSFAQRPWTSPF